MSCGRRLSRQSTGSLRISDDEMNQLVEKLHQLLPHTRRSGPFIKVSAKKVLQETCEYIRSLHKEMDDLSARLSQLLWTADADSPEAAIIRSLTCCD